MCNAQFPSYVLTCHELDGDKVCKMHQAVSHTTTLHVGQGPVNSFAKARQDSRLLSSHLRSRCRRVLRLTAQQGGSSEDAPSRANALSSTVKRKQKQLADLLQDMGMEALEDRLQSATASPLRPPHRFAQLIQVPGDQGQQLVSLRVSCSLQCLLLCCFVSVYLSLKQSWTAPSSCCAS